MKNYVFLFFLFSAPLATAQQLQLHYDFRHTIDPVLHRKNYPTLSFEYFKNKDTTGSFLLKLQTDFNGDRNNAGQTFLQISQNIRRWKPKVYLSFNYSGGLGIAPPAFGYAITNSFALGAAYPFQVKGAWLNASLLYRYTAFPRGSHDVQFNFYFWKGCWQYKLQFSGSLVAWTENRNQGTDFTRDFRGKKLAFFSDPQIWLKVWKGVSVGTRINLLYHVIVSANTLQVYPTIGLKQQF